jgi:hypothetical protein
VGNKYNHRKSYSTPKEKKPKARRNTSYPERMSYDLVQERSGFNS